MTLPLFAGPGSDRGTPVTMGTDGTPSVPNAKGFNGASGVKTVTYDFHQLMEGATKVSCSQFGTEVIKHID